MSSNTNRWILSRLQDRALCLGLCLAVAGAGLLAPGARAGQPAETPAATAVPQQQTFKSPEAAAEALIRAAEQYDIPAFTAILGPPAMDLVASEDPVQDKQRASDFAAEARRRLKVARDPHDSKRAVMLLGEEEWPAPFPIVEKSGTWSFDSEAGIQEVLNRRIGENELDAIQLCRGYVEAQFEYAAEPRAGAAVNQYAQRIVSTPGKQDGLAWQGADGSWQGPVGEDIAKIIAEGYTDRYSPYHGYYFKVLKGQGPAAPLGEIDFVVNGVMIGGFALVAAPADYAVTGVKTFIVSHTGVVYEKDLGPKTLDEFRAMERFDPDSTWTPVEDEEAP